MSLRRKITVLLLATMGAVAVAQILFTQKVERRSRTAELQREAVALSHAITSSIGQTFQYQLLISEYLQHAIDQFGDAPGVLAIRIYDQDGQLVTERLREEDPVQSDIQPRTKRAREVMREGNVVREVAAEGRRYSCLLPIFSIRPSEPRHASGLVELVYRVANPDEPKTLLLDDFANAVTMSIGAIWDLRNSQSTWLGTLAEHLAEHEDIDWIEVFDNRAQVIAHSIPHRVGEPPLDNHAMRVRELLNSEANELEHADPDRKQLNRFVTIHAPNSGNTPAHLGVFELALSTERIDKQVAESRNRQVGFTLAVFGTTGMFLLVAVSRMVTRPLQEVATATGQVAEGKLDTRIDVSRNDEIGALARAFNAMVANVNENIRRRETAENDLRHANDALERRVEARTAELLVKDQAIQSSVAGVAFGTLDGHITDANPAFARMWGYANPDELVGRPATDLSTNQAHVGEIMRAAHRDGHWVGEDIARKKNGTEFPIELTVSVVKDRDDRPVATMATFIDITQRRKAQEAQRKQIDFTRSILAALTSHVAVLDHNGKIVEVNEAWNKFARDNGGERDTGLGADYLRVCRDSAVAGDDLAAQAAAGIESILNGSRQSFSLEYPCHSPNQPRWFLMNATPISNENRGVVISHTNISVRKLAEQELQESKDWLRAIVENAGDGIVAIDQRGIVEMFNQAAERMFGYASQEVIGQNVSLLMPAPHRDQHDAYIDRCLKTGRKRIIAGIGREVEGRRKDGTVVPVRVSVSEIPGDSRRFIGVLHDVTERKEAEKRLLQSARLSAIGEAMAGLTHESRNALARSQANLRRLRRRIENRPDCHDFIDAAVKAQKDVQHLFDEVRQYAAPLKLRFEECDLYRLIETTWRELDESRQGRIVHFQHQPPAFQTKCEVDSFSIRQVFRNILENSVQACRDTARIEVWYANCDFRSAPAIQIHVRDNGPGLTLAEAAKIFDAFYTTRTHGTGLGLAICRRILSEHHGMIGVGSTEGPGAEFVLTLPTTQP